jgi:hypothetical protein
MYAIFFFIFLKFYFYPSTSLRVKVQLELNFNRLAFNPLFVYVKEFAFGKAKDRGKEVAGEGLDFGVEVADVAVVEAARGLYFIFSVG